jgi:hypothetical protein
MTRPKLIDDPRRPFRLRLGVAYRVVEDGQGRLIVRPATQQSINPEKHVPLALVPDWDYV